MRAFLQVLQIAFTYIGTIVGAGFATGQEILQFFTRYGAAAVWTIAAAALMFIWLGTKIMLLSHDIQARSYEDLNRHIFGERAGRYFSLLMLVVLFCMTSIMLAGGGSVFEEHLELPYQLGLFATLMLAFVVIMKGIRGILTVNSFVVPLVLLFTVLIVIVTFRSPNAGHWITRPNDFGIGQTLFSPFLYIGLNLALAQAVLVPLGAAIASRKVVFWGGVTGGAGIGAMLLCGHIALSAHMPGIVQFEIPMGIVVYHLEKTAHLLYLLLIYAEIFTTLIANVYGLTLQLEDKLDLKRPALVATILLFSYAVSQIGFSTLLSTLYPLFGLFSLGWLWKMARFPSSRSVW